MVMVLGSHEDCWVEESSCLEDLNQSKRPIVYLSKKALDDMRGRVE